MKQYNNKIELQRNFQYKVNGIPTDDWKTVYTVYAEVQILSGKDWYNCNKVNSQISGVFKINYIPGLNSQFRVVYNNKNYTIKPPIETELRKTLLLPFEGVG